MVVRWVSAEVSGPTNGAGVAYRKGRSLPLCPLGLLWGIGLDGF